MSIINTLKYFKLFDCPLTTNELRSFLDRTISYENLSDELNELVATEKIIEHQGFYGLDQTNITGRQNRYAVSRRKLNKALAVARIFARLPWIKFIGLANQIGAHNLRDNGDLDFFIVSETDKIWLTRFATATLMALANERPTAANSRDKICLSFFVTADNLNLQPYHLPDQKDLYFIYWLANLNPLYDRADYYQQLIKANPWLTVNLPNWRPADNVKQLKKIKPWTWLNIFNKLEPKLKSWQLAHLPVDIKQANGNGNVFINDTVLKLHVKDRRREFMKSYNT